MLLELKAKVLVRGTDGNQGGREGEGNSVDGKGDGGEQGAGSRIGD